jgi:hypothetical protein
VLYSIAVMCCIPLLYRTEGNMTPTGAQEGTEQESVQADTESVDESLESGNKDTSVATSPSTSVSLETQTAAPGPNTSILQ